MTVILSTPARTFLRSHEIAVLSTLSRDGEVQGAAVYYRLRNNYLYILTKGGSAKAHNMMAHPQVALTIFDPDEIKTVQLQGHATIEGNLKIKREMFELLVKPRWYQGEQLMPPISQLSAGGFITFRITLMKVRYIDYKDETTLLRTHRQV